MNINEIIEKFYEWPNAVALGPSSLESLAYDELWPRDNQMVAVPDNLMRLLYLIREGSSEHRLFLIRLIRYFRPRSRQSRLQNEYEDEDNIVVDRIVDIIRQLERDGRLIVIGEDITVPEIQDALAKVYTGGAFEISLSPKRNFLRDYIVRIYSWSSRTGGMVLEHTRRVFSDIGHHIATLQLPDRLDHYVGLKSRYSGRVFGFRGGKSAKFFVGCAVSIAGLNHPAASIAGVLIAFADP